MLTSSDYLIVIDQSYCFGNPQITFAVIKPGLRFDAHSVGEKIGKRKIHVLFVHAMAMIKQQVGVKPAEKTRQKVH